MTIKTIPFEVRNRFTGDVQFTASIQCAPDAPPGVKLGLAVKWAVKEGAYLTRADLTGAYLSGAYLSDEALRPFKADMWLTLSLSKPDHVQHLIYLLRTGQVDGSTYGDGHKCACLVGSLARAEGKSGDALDHNSDRPAERWFMMIEPGDKPGDETGGGFAAAKALEWAEQWCAAHGHSTEANSTKATGAAE